LKMKVCVVSKHYYPFAGGLESRVVSLSEWLVGNGHSVSVLTSLEPNTKAEDIVKGVVVHRSKSLFSLFNAPFMPQVFSRLFSLDYDLIDVNMPDPVNSIFVYLACVLRGKPFTVTYHADIIKEEWYHAPFRVLYGGFLYLVLGRAGRIFVTSPNYAESSGVLKRFRDKIVVAPSFVDVQRLKPGLDGSNVMVKYGLEGKKVVLFVGRLVAYKGLDYLIDAFGSLSKDFDAALIIVGDGPLEAELKDKVRKLGLSNVFLSGVVSENVLPQYYAACDVFVLPSVTRAEAFGLVLVEALSCGKPVVSTNFSGMPYVVGDAGILVPPRDVSALRNAIGRILSDGKLASELGAKGRKRVAELFSRDVVCRRILDVYKQVSNRIN